MAKMRKFFAMAWLCIRRPGTLFKGIKYLKNNGIKGFLSNMKSRAAFEVSPESGQWEVKPEKGPFHGDILFSILMPVYNVEEKWIRKAIDSVKAQTYLEWELCIADDCSTKEETREFLRNIKDEQIHVTFLEKNGGISRATNEAAGLAKGDYILLMDNDDVLAPHALYEFYKEIKKSDADIIYSDQDIIDQYDCHREPLHKPDFSMDLLLGQMYIGHLLGFKRSLFEASGGFRSEFNGSQDYDLMLRMSRRAEKIAHIPKILYSWRDLPSSTAANPESKPYAQTAGLRAVQEYLDSVYPEGASASETEALFVYDVRYPVMKPAKVSVIMPTKDHADLLGAVIKSIEEKTDYPDYEILILDNNSKEQETFRCFKELQEAYSNVKVIDAPFKFNWSKLNNLGITKASGDVFIFMNNDMEVISPEWMQRLAEKALRKGTGVVGGLLLYEDGTIQHAGVVTGIGGWADHIFKGMKPVHYGSPFISPMVTRNVTAVTGACMAISRETIERIGNFDEEFIVCGSDIEICIRAINRGLVNVYDPYVKLYHYESKSRDARDIPEVDFQLSYKMYKNYHNHTDPYYNINLDPESCIPRRRNGQKGTTL